MLLKPLSLWHPSSYMVDWYESLHFQDGTNCLSFRQWFKECATLYSLFSFPHAFTCLNASPKVRAVTSEPIFVTQKNTETEYLFICV